MMCKPKPVIENEWYYGDYISKDNTILCIRYYGWIRNEYHYSIGAQDNFTGDIYNFPIILQTQGPKNMK